MDFFEVKDNLTGLSFDFLSDVMGIGCLCLIAENVENFGVLTGFYVTIPAIGLDAEPNIFASR